MEPRCTGMCGALATSCASLSNSAHEKSSRSLILTEYAVFASASPICSAIDMKRLPNSSSRSGSTAVSTACAGRCGISRRSNRWFRGVSAARHPGSTTVVELASRITAGPSIRSPGRRASRSKNGVGCQRSLQNTGCTASGTRVPWRSGNSGACSALRSLVPMHSTLMDSTISERPGIRKPKRAR